MDKYRDRKYHQPKDETVIRYAVDPMSESHTLLGTCKSQSWDLFSQITLKGAHRQTDRQTDRRTDGQTASLTSLWKSLMWRLSRPSVLDV